MRLDELEKEWDNSDRLCLLPRGRQIGMTTLVHKLVERELRMGKDVIYSGSFSSCVNIYSYLDGVKISILDRKPGTFKTCTNSPMILRGLSADMIVINLERYSPLRSITLPENIRPDHKTLFAVELSYNGPLPIDVDVLEITRPEFPVWV